MSPYVSPTPPPTPTWAAAFIISNFILAYVLCGTHLPKRWLGFDRNVSPREEVGRYGEGWVGRRRISESGLARLRRWESLHANAMQNFPLFFGSVVFALHAGVPNSTIDRLCAMYTLARTGYAVACLAMETEELSWVRTACWWVGSGSALLLVGKAGGRLNEGTL